MNKRFTAVALCLLYFTLAVGGGALHHHHKGGDLFTHKDCSACALHINGITDVPVAFAIATHAPVEFTTFHFTAVPFPAYLFPLTASRAPPFASA